MHCGTILWLTFVTFKWLFSFKTACALHLLHQDFMLLFLASTKYKMWWCLYSCVFADITWSSRFELYLILLVYFSVNPSASELDKSLNISDVSKYSLDQCFVKYVVFRLINIMYCIFSIIISFLSCLASPKWESKMLFFS